MDASKTGDFFTIPKHLAPPARRAKPMAVVWKKMESLAEEFKQQFSFLVIPAHVEDAACLSEDFILGILHDKNRKIPEFELLSVNHTKQKQSTKTISGFGNRINLVKSHFVKLYKLMLSLQAKLTSNSTS